MVLVVVVIVLGLIGAGAVLLVASVAGGRSEGLAEFVADLRAGLRRGGTDTRPADTRPTDARSADTRSDDTRWSEDHEGVPVPLQPAAHGVDQLFLVGRPAPGYVDSEELSQTLNLATRRAARGVALLTRR